MCTSMRADRALEAVPFLGYSAYASSLHKNTAENAQLLWNPPSWEVMVVLAGIPVKGTSATAGA